MTPLTSSPSWLASLTADSIHQGPLPLKELLSGAVYYPAAGQDGRAIRFMSSYIPSFVQVDYSLREAEVRQALTTLGCFAGYELIGLRNVSQQELTPSGWRPSLVNAKGHREMPPSANPDNAFALWAVFERTASHDARHGAERFSLLHLHAEGVAAYDALYLGHQVQAGCVAIINPGEGFGDNWTYFTKPDDYLHQLVERNPVGMPAYLLHGGGGHLNFYAEKACWPEYQQLVKTYDDQAEHYHLTLWQPVKYFFQA